MAKKKADCVIKRYHELTSQEISVIHGKYHPFIRQVGNALFNRNTGFLHLPEPPMHPRDRLVSAQFNVVYQKGTGTIAQIDMLFVIAEVTDGFGTLGQNRYYLKDLTDWSKGDSRGLDNE